MRSRPPPTAYNPNLRIVSVVGPLHKRKNWLFAGRDTGRERAALFYTLIHTSALNGAEPEVYLRHEIARICGRPVNRLHELRPWNVAASATHSGLIHPPSSR